MAASQASFDRSSPPAKISSDDAPLSDSSAKVAPAKPKRGYQFWLVFLGLSLSIAVNAIEIAAISTALPTIIHELGGGTSFIWIGSAYTLCCTAVIPFSGGLAQIVGRRPVMLAALTILAVGSVICGAAKNMQMLIAGRVVQGLGAGGIASSNAIIVSDMVPLHERGAFNGLIGISWSIFNALGPVIAGLLTEHGQWRWLFYMNIPILGFVAVLIQLFLRVPTPSGTVREKLARIDWIGNIIVIGASTATVLGLTWGGVQYAWSSAQVLAPLIIGLVGLVVFLGYEAKVAKYPVVPFNLMGTITGCSGYLQTFFMPIVMMMIIYYIPVYFQACKSLSTIRSGVAILPLALVASPAGVVAGITVKMSNRYRPQLWLSWVCMVLGTALLTTIHASTALSHTLVFLAIVALGIGILTTTTYFPVLAPLPVESNALALAYFMFLRNFAQVWGVSLGGTVLQNALESRLPAAILDMVPASQRGTLQFSIIPQIRTLSPDLQVAVKDAFGESVALVFKVAAGIAGVGLLVSLPMKHMKLHTTVDERWALEERKGEPSLESQSESK